MKCCECKKEVDTTESSIPPTWYGRYRVSQLEEVICADCIKEPEKKQRWSVRR